jgi:hypothetical protein
MRVIKVGTVCTTTCTRPRLTYLAFPECTRALEGVVTAQALVANEIQCLVDVKEDAKKLRELREWRKWWGKEQEKKGKGKN